MKLIEFLKVFERRGWNLSLGSDQTVGIRGQEIPRAVGKLVEENSGALREYLRLYEEAQKAYQENDESTFYRIAQRIHALHEREMGFYSPLFDRVFRVGQDGSVWMEGVVYSWEEVQALQGVSDEELKRLHLAKKVFKGEVGKRES